MGRQQAQERSFATHEEELDDQPSPPQLAPGKRTLSAGLPRVPSAQAGGPLSPEVRRQLASLGGSAGLGATPAGVDPFAMFSSDGEAQQALLMAEAERSPSTGLPGGIRGRLEGALGEDLSGVRLHSGGAPERAASALGARAFAVGSSIYFGSGALDLGSPAGLHLLAHEVAHTVQQRGALARPQLMPLQVGPAGDAHEVEADGFAVAFASGRPLPARPVSRGVVTAVRAQPIVDFFKENWEYFTPAGPLAGLVLDKTGAGDAAVDWVGKFALDHIDDAGKLLMFLLSAQTYVARQVVGFILEHRPQILQDMLMLWPGHAVTKKIIGWIPWDWVLDAFKRVAEIAWGAAKVLFEVLWKHNPAKALALALFDLAKEATEFILRGAPTDWLRDIIAPVKHAIADFLRWLMNKVMPLGRGFSFLIGGGVTPGLPIHIAGDYEANMTRKTDDQVRVLRRAEARLAADSGASVGFYAGNQQGLGAGAAAGYTAEAGLKAILLQEFEFPVIEDDALIGVVLAFFAADFGIMGNVASVLFGGGVDPWRYNTKTQIEAKAYAEASAGAEAGLKLGNDKTEPYKVQRGDNATGAPNTGSSPWWLRLAGLSASIMARAHAEAGVGAELKQKWGPDRSLGPISAELELYVEAEAGLEAAASIPGIPFLPQLPALSGGIGAKLIYDAYPHPASDLGYHLIYKGAQMYVKRGDTDRFMGGGTEIAIGVNEQMFDSIEDFKEQLPNQEIEVKHRFPLSTGLGTGWVRKHEANLRSMLPKEGKALILEGFIGFKATMSGEEAKQILERIVAASRRVLAKGPKKLVTDFLHFLQTGEGPAYIRRELDAVAAALAPHVEELILRAQAEFRYMTDVHAADGIKFRASVRAGAGISVEYDLLRGGEKVLAADIKSLLGGLEDAVTGSVIMPPL